MASLRRLDAIAGHGDLAANCMCGGSGAPSTIESQVGGRSMYQRAHSSVMLSSPLGIAGHVERIERLARTLSM